jgi:large subunit ribosomal protein L24
MHVKKNDLVVILSGNDRGKRGKVLSVDGKSQRVVVEGIRMMKKSVRKNPNKPQGGFLEREAPLHISKVMLAELYDKRAGKKKGAKAATA